MQFGDYQLKQRLGTGGMGEVWAADHPVFGHVAVKRLHGTRTDQLGPIFAEARAVAQLDHPNVVRLFDCGSATAEDGDEQGYLAMERLALPVASLGSWSWERLRGLLKATLSGLAHAHASGVIHCDVKPENMLLANPADIGSVKLVDFGIAQRRDARQGGRPVGSPVFMAPEQRQRGGPPLGPWTDLFSVGVVAWTIASGRPPWTGSTAAQGRLPAFHARFPTPDGFQDWLEWLLERDPDDRPEDAPEADWALDDLGQQHSTTEEVDLEPFASTSDTISVTGILEEEALPRFESGPITAPRRFEPYRSFPALNLSRPSADRPVGLGLVSLRRLPLLGRRREQSLLWERLGQAVRSGTPRVVVVRGEAHAGRTALLRWLAEAVAETGAATSWWADHGPLSDRTGLDRAALTSLQLDDQADPQGRIGALAQRWPTLARHAEALSAWTRGDLSIPIERYREALVDAALVRTARRPLVVILDDAHWATEALEMAARLTRLTAPILIVVSVRSDLIGDLPTIRSRLAELTSMGGAVSLDLAPPARRDVRALVDTVLPLQPRLNERLVEGCGGDPLLAVQVVRGWVSRGALFRDANGRWGPRNDEDLEIPQLSEVFRRRLDELGPPEAWLRPLSVAVALGRRVSIDEWRRALGKDPGPWVQALVNHELAWSDGRALTFAHPGVSEAVRALAQRSGDWPLANEACSEALPEAFKTAPGRFGLWRLASGDNASAWMAFTGALRQASVSGELDAGLRLIEPALASCRSMIPEEADARELDIYDSCIRLYVQLGRMDEVRQALPRFEELALRSGSLPALAETRLYRANVEVTEGKPQLALDLSLEALDLAERSGDSRVVARCHRGVAIYANILGRIDEALAHANQGVHAEGTRSERIWGPLTLGMIHANRSEFAEALAHLERAKALALELGDISGLNYVHLILGDVYRHLGDFTSAEATYRSALERYWLSRDSRSADARVYMGLIAMRQGQLDSARSSILRALESLTAGRRELVGAVARTFLVECLLRMGHVEEARREWAILQARFEKVATADLDVAESFEHQARLTAEVDPAWSAELWRAAAKEWRAAGHPHRADAIPLEASPG